MTDVHFEIVDHTADWALKVYGRNLTDLFIHAAEGMTALLLAEETAVTPTKPRTLTLQANDAEELLVDWLSELAYWAETEQFVATKIDITNISQTGLQAVVEGGTASELTKHIKAVTYHQLAITETAVGLTVTIVFDV